MGICSDVAMEDGDLDLDEDASADDDDIDVDVEGPWFTTRMTREEK